MLKNIDNINELISTFEITINVSEYSSNRSCNPKNTQFPDMNIREKVVLFRNVE